MSNGYVEVVKVYRLWAEVPQHERLTEDDVLRKYPPGRWADFVSERLIERLRHPGCEIAVRFEQSSKWIPCGQEAYGQARCKRHGGPGKPVPDRQRRNRVTALEDENQRLRERIAELEAGAE